MNKDTKLKLQLFSSIGIATLIILFSAIFFFIRLSHLLQQNEVIIANTEDQIFYCNKIEPLLFKIIQYKSDYATQKEGINTIDYQFTQDEIDQTLVMIKKIAIDEQLHNQTIIDKFEKLEKAVSEITTIPDSAVENQEKFLLELIDKQYLIRVQVHQFIDALLLSREDQVTLNKKSIQLAKDISIGLIAIALFIFIYTFIKIFQAIQYMRKSSRKLRHINADYRMIAEKMEITNWVAESNALLIERLSGIDQEEKISNIVLGLLNETLPITATSVFIRKSGSDTFLLRSSSGIEPEHKIASFSEGKGYLGKIAHDKKLTVLSSEQYPSLRPKTSTLESIPVTIYLCPLVHEGKSVGLIELAIKDDGVPTEKYETFLLRASRNIAMSIKIGQSHLLVEKLLEETQQQTEELEAQQEELRITNDELIHKTHLLESSEEELRVQQEELSQANFELNQKAIELGKKNNELHEAQQIVEQKIREIEQASRYKSEFMANMSHELRTPLNSILILAKLLNDNKGKNLTSEQVKYAHVIHSAGTDLLALIDELLDLAKIESGKIDLNEDTIEIKEFIESIEELFIELAKDKEIDFEIKIDPRCPRQIVSDEYRIQQVLKNFLSNAFKFTNKGGKVTFSVQEKDGEIYFEVSDTGKGISKEKQALIFEAFRQEDGSTSRKYGGTGLGLSISREIAHLLNGRIQLDSELGRGSSFILIIPTQQTKQSLLEQQLSFDIDKSLPPAEQQLLEVSDIESSQEDKKPQEILIIEDDINFAAILKGFAKDYGFEVRLAHDGALGIKLAQEHLPDAIILDVMLPISDGWEVLGELKKNPKTRHIPIHMMSAASFNKKELLEKGAIGFMHKPVTEEAIQQTFDNIDLNLSKSIKKVLLIEDQEPQSELIKNTFSEHRINVIQAFTMESGLKKIKEEPNIDCIILDLRLPDGSGLEFIEKIKEDTGSNDIPIIINTAAELTREEHDEILSYAKTTVLKSSKSNDRLIDEVNLFLNKINNPSYTPVRDPQKVSATNYAKDLSGKTVLIADDDMRNVFALSTSLQAVGMKIEIANNGAEAVKLIEEKGEHIDIVLMDIMMPEMDGHEAIQKIRNNVKYKSLPILAVTAKAMKGDREKSLQIGANDYVSKPIDINKLTSLMQIWLS
ncbi:MAG TPA: response regulator [Sphingobacterium sp.]|nr:response regulator [Sphingobacterium sp.]